jgi:hypothetical protein
MRASPLLQAVRALPQLPCLPARLCLGRLGVGRRGDERATLHAMCLFLVENTHRYQVCDLHKTTTSVTFRMLLVLFFRTPLSTPFRPRPRS